MGNFEFGEPEPSGEAEDLIARRERIANAYFELRMAISDLIESGMAQDGRAHTPELIYAEELGEQLKGEPVRGVLHGARYYLDAQPPGWLSVPHRLPHGFSTPTVLGIFEGAVKMHKVQEDAELMIGVSPLATSENEAIQAFYQNDGLAKNRLHQPLGLKKQHLDRGLWLPAVEFKLLSWSMADDYLASEIKNAEGFRAFFRRSFPPEQPEAE